MKRITNARVVTEDSVVPDACIEVQDGIIVSVSSGRTPVKPGDIDLKGAWLVPGFLDLHVHPEMPSSLLDLRQHVQELSRKLMAIGTTGILWTTGAGPFEERIRIARALREVLADPPSPCVVLGIHEEGPYISTNTPEELNMGFGTPERYPLETIIEAAGPALKYVSVSPDVPGILNVIQECVKRGVRVGMGHSSAPHEIAGQAVEAGATAVIHTFNNSVCCPMKEPGVRDVTLDEYGMISDRVTSELICDGIHVDPILVRLLAKVKPADRLILITDSVGGGRSLTEGYEIKGRSFRIVIRGGVGRTEENMMAGSALTMERAFRNFIKFTGASMPEAVRVSSLNAARFLGLDRERGRIAPGFRADFAALDEGLTPCMDRMAGLHE